MMKNISLFIPAMLLLGASVYALHSIPEPSSPIAITWALSSTLCFLAAFALIGWQHWLEFQQKRELEEKVGPLGKENAAKDREIAELRGKLDAAKRPTAPLPSPEQRLLELAEKLRSKAIRETKKHQTTDTTDEVPQEVRAYVLEQFQVILSSNKNENT